MLRVGWSIKKYRFHWASAFRHPIGGDDFCNATSPSALRTSVLDDVEILSLGADPLDRERFTELIQDHHYLKSDLLAGEQLPYVAIYRGQWGRLPHASKRQPQ